MSKVLHAILSLAVSSGFDIDGSQPYVAYYGSCGLCGRECLWSHSCERLTSGSRSEATFDDAIQQQSQKADAIFI